MTLLFLNFGGYELVLMFLIGTLFALVPLIFSIIIIRSRQFTLTEKLLWILLLWFVPVVGILVYLIYSSTSKAR